MYQTNQDLKKLEQFPQFNGKYNKKLHLTNLIEPKNIKINQDFNVSNLYIHEIFDGFFTKQDHSSATQEEINENIDYQTGEQLLFHKLEFLGLSFQYKIPTLNKKVKSKIDSIQIIKKLNIAVQHENNSDIILTLPIENNSQLLQTYKTLQENFLSINSSNKLPEYQSICINNITRNLETLLKK